MSCNDHSDTLPLPALIDAELRMRGSSLEALAEKHAMTRAQAVAAIERCAPRLSLLPGEFASDLAEAGIARGAAA